MSEQKHSAIETLESLLESSKQDVRDAEPQYRDHEQGRVAGIRQCIQILESLQSHESADAGWTSDDYRAAHAAIREHAGFSIACDALDAVAYRLRAARDARVIIEVAVSGLQRALEKLGGGT